jgi:leucyl aminopeptidase
MSGSESKMARPTGTRSAIKGVRPEIAALFSPSAPGRRRIPVLLVADQDALAGDGRLDGSARAWLADLGFKAKPRHYAVMPAKDGRIKAIVLAVGGDLSGELGGPATLNVAALAAAPATVTYELDGELAEPELAAVAFGLGAYRFRTYKQPVEPHQPPCLALPAGADRSVVETIVGAVWHGRDLINTPASDMGPAELEAAARAVAERHGADIEVVTGDGLLAGGFNMIHAVGRASSRAPRLIDINWGRRNAQRVTLVGKGVCFDTGGLDIKPSAAMLLMKKDMGGAASALTLAEIIMGLKLNLRLRVLIPAVENSVAGNAFRPGDVLTSRAGTTVEIGNTDAEGRLVLADALALADEDEPERLFTFSTLTGAARVALGPDLPAMFTDDDKLAAEVAQAGARVGDPVWRLPFWPGYERNLDSEVADMGNVSDGPFAGAITAALFLRRFVKRARQFAHFDLYGWRPSARAIGPKGGEPQVARALAELLRQA